MEIRLKINDKFDNLKLDEIFDLFSLGKEKRKEFHYDKKKIYKKGEVVILNYKPKPVIPFDKKIDIVFEDKYILAVNKERYLLTHPDDISNQETLVNMVKNYLKKTKQDADCLYLGRLDYETTGLVIFAKDILTHAYLSNLVSQNKLHRSYLAIAKNRFKDESGVIDMPIGRDRHNAKKMRISKTGKVAITKYRVLRKLKNNLSMVELDLLTGRTHQIRLHLSAINHPILGDKLYDINCDTKYPLMLHSSFVKFSLPYDEKEYLIWAELPIEFERVVGELK